MTKPWVCSRRADDPSPGFCAFYVDVRFARVYTAEQDEEFRVTYLRNTGIDLEVAVAPSAQEALWLVESRRNSDTVWARARKMLGVRMMSGMSDLDKRSFMFSRCGDCRDFWERVDRLDESVARRAPVQRRRRRQVPAGSHPEWGHARAVESTRIGEFQEAQDDVLLDHIAESSGLDDPLMLRALLDTDDYPDDYLVGSAPPMWRRDTRNTT